VVLTGPSAVFVRTEPAAAASQAHSRVLVARVAFDDRRVAAIGPPVQGRVSRVNVVTGDRVERGAPLLTIRAPDIASAQAQVTQSRTARLLAEQVAARADMLAERGAGSDAERQQAQAALLQARAEERRAVASLNAIGGASGSSDYLLRSPIAGMVVERTVTVGSEVSAGQERPLLTVADLSTVWVIADVYERDLARVDIGDEAVVEVLSFPGRQFTGRITYVSNIVDSQTRAASARIEISNPDLALRPGMFARVQVNGLAVGAADIPMSAVLARRDQFFVFVRNEDGSYSQREVTLGEQHGQHTTVLAGLRPGELVVTEGAILLDAEANEAL
jgi:cobalt-zinc-cadmium efflux system membrane fusion protein